MSAAAPEDARPVSIAAVEAELAELWRPAPDAPPLTRACMSNLIIYCSSARDLERVEGEIPDVARAHPSRVLLLAADPQGPSRGIEASVQAACYLAGPGRKICSEQITLRAAGGDLAALPGAARALLIGDLPTALWWEPSDEPPHRGGRLFEQLVAMSDHLVFDSRGWLDPERGVIETADWAASVPRLPITDLAWLRLEHWRRHAAEALDPAVAPGALESLAAVAIEHGPHALPKAWLFVGWLSHALGWRPERGEIDPGVRIGWDFATPHGPVHVGIRRLPEGEPVLQCVQIGWGGEGAGCTRIFERAGRERICLRDATGVMPPRFVPILEQSRATLVARDLQGRSGRDLYREALVASRAMAEVIRDSVAG